MKRNKNKRFYPFKYLIIPIILFLIPFIYNLDGGSPTPVFAFESTDSTMGMEIVPDHELFNIENFAPGGVVTRRLTVKNTGQGSFKYNVVSSLKEGSELLFNKLNLEIKDVANNNLKYKGTLNGLNTIELGVLQPNEKSELDFTVEFPPESGNEYQGLATSFTLIIGAEQATQDNPPEPPVIEPIEPVPPQTPTDTAIVGLPNTGGAPAQKDNLLRIRGLTRVMDRFLFCGGLE